MKQKITLLCTFLCCYAFVCAQTEYWQTNYNGSAGFQNHVNSSLFEKQFSFVSVSGKAFYENTYFLELNNIAPLPITGSSLSGHYFYATEVENNGSPFYFAAQRTGSGGSAFYLNTFTPSNLLQSSFELPDVFEVTNSKGPAAIQATDQEIIIFGNTFFHKVNIASDGTMNLDWSKPATYGLIADAKPYDGGYILCNESEKLIYMDGNVEEVWVKDLGSPLRAVLVLEDGFMIAAEKDGERALIKTDFDGDVIWEKKYGAGLAVDLDFAQGNGIVFTGKGDDGAYVIKVDLDGELVWEENYTGSATGSKIIKSQRGGYLLQTKMGPIITIIRLDDNGNTGDLINDIPPKNLTANNLGSTANARGELFWDGDDTNTTFPKDSITTTIFAGGLWISGFNQDGGLHTAAHLYQNGDFSPGPFELETQDIPAWDKAWKISKKEILRLRDDLSDGTLDGPITLDFLTYPGAGNPNFNLFSESNAVVPDDMAPFIDTNSDGIYNALDGDYPDIKGDEMIWWVMKNRFTNSNIGGLRFDFEIRGSLYAYACEGNAILYNTDFLELDIINHSTNDYSNLYIGTFLDFDIGCYLDDYIGSLPATNSIFSYNKDASDNTPCQGVASFTPGNIPIQSVTYLNTDMDYSMHTTGFLGEPNTGDPNSPEGLRNFLQGTWPDGTPQTVGGVGYGGTVPSDYVFPGNPTSNSEWSMCTNNLANTDRRMIMSTGPNSLMAGQTLHLDIGLTAHENINYPCPDISQVENEINELQNLYNSGTLDYSLDLGPDLDFTAGQTITLDAGAGASTYAWSTGAISQSIDVSNVGIYTVTITTISGCEYTDEINIGGFVNINEVQAKAPKIYPNPTSSQLFVALTADVPKYITLENTLGQTLQSFPVAIGTQHSIMELNIGKLPQGIYLLRFHFEDADKMLLRKVVVGE